MTKSEILRIVQQEQIQFLRLQFTDILGQIKNVEIPATKISAALDEGIFFDGSSTEGFSRKKEQDMVLVPDYNTFQVYPWDSKSENNRLAIIVCDIFYPDGREFEGCPRLGLKKIVNECSNLGFTYLAGAELEFFMFQKNSEGKATLTTHDPAGYFDLTPDDIGGETRRHIVKTLEKMDYKIASSHHEVSPGQHEIDFTIENPIKTADQISGCKFVIRNKANEFGMHATFMPKPLFEHNGSGLHFNQVLLKDNDNVFYDPASDKGLSKTANYFIGGQLAHSRGYAAITNPLINSYKRLVGGKEAPIYTIWSDSHSAPMVRIPNHGDKNPVIELRLPDPSCNPYSAFAVILKAGLDGIKNKTNNYHCIDKEIENISQREQARLKIDRIPKDLYGALSALKKDKLVQEGLGDYIYQRFIEAKNSEWNNYISQIHPWEIEKYFTTY